MLVLAFSFYVPAAAFIALALALLWVVALRPDIGAAVLIGVLDSRWPSVNVAGETLPAYYVLVLLLAFVAGWKILLRRPLGFKPCVQDLAVLAYMGFVIFLLGRSPEPMEQLRPVLRILFAAGIYFLLRAFLNGRKQLLYIGGWAIAFRTLLAVLALLALVFIVRPLRPGFEHFVNLQPGSLQPREGLRFTGFHTDPNIWGLLMAMNAMAAFALLLAFPGERPLAKIGAFVVCMLAIVPTFSRGAAMVTVIWLLWAMAAFRSRFSARWIGLVAAILAVAIGTGMLLVPRETLMTNISRIIHPFGSNSGLEPRVQHYLYLSRRMPYWNVWFGEGMAYVAGGPNIAGMGGTASEQFIHSLPLELLHSTGFAGVVLYVLLCAVIIVPAYISYRECQDAHLRAALGILLALLLGRLFHSLFFPANLYTPITWCLFALLTAATQAHKLDVEGR